MKFNASKVIVLAALLLTSHVARADVGRAQRSFGRFAFDPVSANGLWAELIVANSHEDVSRRTPFGNVNADIDVTTLGPRIAYGWDHFEVGISETAYFTSFDGPGGSDNDEGIGDSELYGKFLFFPNGPIDLAAGLHMVLPTGDDDYSGDEFGFLPFGSVGVGPRLVNARAHLGYQAFTGSADQGDPADSWVYGVGVFSNPIDLIGLRAEIVGQSLDARGDGYIDMVEFQPGVDLNLNAGPLGILLRLNGACGLTDNSADWGIGGSVALTWSPGRHQ